MTKKVQVQWQTLDSLGASWQGVIDNFNKGGGGCLQLRVLGLELSLRFEEGELMRIDMAITEFRMIEDMVAVFAERYLSMPLEVGGCSYCPLPLVCTTRAQHGHEAPAPCLFKVDCPQVEATLRSEGLLDW